MALQKLKPNSHASPIGLLMIGATRRLFIALVIALALWAGFFWATTSPGGL